MRERLAAQGYILIGVLTLQYLVGMYVNLFVQFPDQTGDQLWGFAWSQPALALHIILAFLILIGAIVLCVRAARRRDRTWIWASGIGLLAVLAAGASGASFIPTQNDILSYSMAVAFIIAISAYSAAISAEPRT